MPKTIAVSIKEITYETKERVRVLENEMTHICKSLNEISNNHLPHIQKAMDELAKEIENLKIDFAKLAVKVGVIAGGAAIAIQALIDILIKK